MQQQQQQQQHGEAAAIPLDFEPRQLMQDADWFLEDAAGGLDSW